MAKRVLVVTATLAMILSVPTLTHAQAQSCDQLWCGRNSLFKAAGYCFRTPRAIAAFGNAGCTFDSEYDVPLSARQRATVAEIKAQESALGCSR